MSTTGENREHCPALTKTGRACRGWALPDTGLCIAHSPQAAQWRTRGGVAHANANRAEKLLPSRLRPITEGLERAFRDVLAGDVDPRTATAAATVAAAIVRVYQAGEQEERLRDIEADLTRWRERDRGRWPA
jgi:hypothetical protein